MTNAIFREHPDEGAIEMRVLGHTGFAEMGKDPVCAGASIHAFTVAACIEAMHKMGKLQKEPNVTISGGNVRVVAKPKPEYMAEAKLVFYYGMTGFKLLEQSYPEYVTLTPFIIPKGNESGGNE